MASATRNQLGEARSLIDLNVAGLRIQIIWKTDEGGNHHDHVHVGARPRS